MTHSLASYPIPGVRYPAARTTRSTLPVLLVAMYTVLIVGKAFLGYRDGVVDVVLWIVLIGWCAPRIRRVVSRVWTLPLMRGCLIFWAYYVALALFQGTAPRAALLEFFSVQKWLIYFLLGGLLAATDRNAVCPWRFPEGAFFGIVVLVFGISLFSYDWSGLANGDIYSTFYQNSFAAVFSHRSVFALFGLIAFYRAVTAKGGMLGGVQLVLGLVLMFLAGNRKMLVALLAIGLGWRFRRGSLDPAKILFIIALITGAIAISRSALGTRTLAEYWRVDQPRVALYLGATAIAADYFPIGPGPATFASRGSMDDYSSLYYDYGFAGRWGFRPDDEIQFYSDTYWAQVIGQYGLVGTLLLAIILLQLAFYLKEVDARRARTIPSLLMFGVLLLTSIVSPYFQRTEMGLFLMIEWGALATLIKARA